MACHRCGELEKELTKTRANFKALHEKIVSTDLLIKKYKEKCSQLDIARKHVSELTQSLEAAQRAVHTLRDQLEDAMLRSASPGVDLLQVQSERDTAMQELEATKLTVESQLMLIMQLEARIGEKDEQLKQMELEKELKQEEVAQANASAKRFGEQVERLKKQKSEQKSITKELTATKRKEQTLQKQLVAANEEVKRLKSELGNRKREVQLNGFSQLGVFSPKKFQPSRKCQKETHTKSRKDQPSVANREFHNGFPHNGFSFHPLSPLPPSPKKHITKQKKPKLTSPQLSISSQDESLLSVHSTLNGSVEDQSETVSGSLSTGECLDDKTELRTASNDFCHVDGSLSVGNYSGDNGEGCDSQTARDVVSVSESREAADDSLFGSNLSDFTASEDEMDTDVGEQVVEFERGSCERGQTAYNCNGENKEEACEVLHRQDVDSVDQLDAHIAVEGVLVNAAYNVCETKTQNHPEDFIDVVGENNEQNYNSSLESTKVDAADQHQQSSQKSEDKNSTSRLTDTGECDDNSLTKREMDVSCDASSKQFVGEGVKGRDEKGLILSDCAASCLTKQMGNNLSHFSRTQTNHTESSLSSVVGNAVDDALNKSQHKDLPSMPSPTFYPPIHHEPTETNSSRLHTKFWQLLWSLEAKSDLSPLPVSSASTMIVSPPQSFFRKSHHGPTLSPLSSRSWQINEVVNSLRLSGSKRKLLFGGQSDTEEDFCLPPPKKFSSAVATSAILVKPKPIRHAKSVPVMTQSETVMNETRYLVPGAQVECCVSKQTVPSQSSSRTVSDTPAFSVDTDMLVGACDASIAGKSESVEIADGEMEEGELVEEPVEVVEKLEIGKQAKVVAKKSGINKRPLNQSEESYITKGLHHLRQQSVSIDDLATAFSHPENVSRSAPLAQGIVTSLSQRKDDVSKNVQAVCLEVQRNPAVEIEPVLSLYERQLLRLVAIVRTAPSQSCLVETLLRLLPRQLCRIKENRWNTAFTCGLRAACVCRLFTSLCRQEGDAERLRVFCFDLLREFTPFTVKELLCIEAIALVWPQAIRRQPSCCMYRDGHVYLDAVHPQLLLCVMEALLMTQFKCLTNVQYEVLESIVTLLHWSQVPAGCLAAQELAMTLTKFLCHSAALGVSVSGDCPALNPTSFELVKCLEILSHWMGTAWMDGFLVRQLLWPVIKDWMSSVSESKEPRQNKHLRSDAPVATICRFFGCAGRMAMSNDDLLDRLVSILSSILAQAPAADQGVLLVQLCAALSLSDLAPWRPREVESALKQWIDAVSESGSNDRLLISFPNVLRQRMHGVT